MVEGSDDSHSPDVLAPEMEPSSVLKTYVGAVAPGEECAGGGNDTSVGGGKAHVKLALEPEVKGVGLKLGLIEMAEALVEAKVEVKPEVKPEVKVETKAEAKVEANVEANVEVKVEVKDESLEAPWDAGLLSDLLATGLEP